MKTDEPETRLAAQLEVVEALESLPATVREARPSDLEPYVRRVRRCAVGPVGVLVSPILLWWLTRLIVEHQITVFSTFTTRSRRCASSGTTCQLRRSRRRAKPRILADRRVLWRGSRRVVRVRPVLGGGPRELRGPADSLRRSAGRSLPGPPRGKGGRVQVRRKPQTVHKRQRCHWRGKRSRMRPSYGRCSPVRPTAHAFFACSRPTS